MQSAIKKPPEGGFSYNYLFYSVTGLAGNTQINAWLAR